MPSWPATLPQNFKADGYSETGDEVVVRTEMDAGPPKVRRRHTAKTTLLGGRMILTKTQVATLESFLILTVPVEPFLLHGHTPARERPLHSVGENTRIFLR